MREEGFINMNEIIQSDCILLELDCHSKESVMEQLVLCLEEKGVISQGDNFLKTLLERERIFPTSIGKLIAIPHGISECVKHPSLCIGRLKKPILWDKEKSEYAIFIIMIAVPITNENNIHIQIISYLMRHLMHDEYIEKLLISDKQGILELLKGVDQ